MVADVVLPVDAAGRARAGWGARMAAAGWGAVWRLTRARARAGAEAGAEAGAGAGAGPGPDVDGEYDDGGIDFSVDADFYKELKVRIETFKHFAHV